MDEDKRAIRHSRIANARDIFVATHVTYQRIGGFFFQKQNELNTIYFYFPPGE